MEFTAEQISQLLNGRLEGDKDLVIRMIGTIEKAQSDQLAFLSNPLYEKFIYTTNAGAVLVKNTFKPLKNIKATLIYVEDPYSSFSLLLKEYEKLLKYSKSGIEEPSFIDETAQYGEGLYLGSFSYIGKNVKIGNNVKIYPQCYIGDEVQIGDNTILYANVKIYTSVEVGSNCILHSGCVVGSDGFGFAPQKDGSYEDIPQLGSVKIHNNVNLGANMVIDRATLPGEYTIIGEGTKLDNLIQIGHNASVGKNTVIAALSGIAGSGKVGNNCMLGGQTGVGGHITVADGTKVGAQTGVISSITDEKTSVMGTPAFSYISFMKSYAIFKKLPEIVKTIKNYDSKIQKDIK
ncbi:MAG: UDP-3-O-(3-hydroxymyristoyl)glucosamine N-acyltransferase [Cyclobacteriaceae bacterium]|nr:UDP-3-O-(3-hydroxymyristoyl)glucosamine N-acyltransferase [Cyclobacteriaceae bacterium]